jgi:hypothetical protein
MTPSNRDPIQFTRESGERIARVVRAAELEPARGSPLTFDPILFGKGSVIKLGTFTGSWQIGTTTEVTFYNVTTTPNTVAVENLLMSIGDACRTQVAFYSRVGHSGNLQLINVEHHQTAVVVAVTLTTAALTFQRKLAWMPYPAAASSLEIPLSTDTAC